MLRFTLAALAIIVALAGSAVMRTSFEGITVALQRGTSQVGQPPQQVKP